MYRLSICIPTFNRCDHLANCLNSIILNTHYQKEEIQICISDNCSTDKTEEVVQLARQSVDIVYCKNERNIGLAGNFLNVVNMADGEFVWIIGDDDLLLPSALGRVVDLIDGNTGVDYFYVNSFHLESEYVFKFLQPFNTVKLPNNMERFSSWSIEGEMHFLDLINPDISFDFLGGMFLSVFRREMWIDNVNKLDSTAIQEGVVFSHFDNTFPHVKIFANAFCDSKAYFHPRPLSVCLSGAREWAPMYPFIRSVRLVEALDEYRRNGLPYWRYLKYKNYALRHFIPDMLYTIAYREDSGYKYLRLSKLLENVFYPEFYLSPFRFIFKFRNLRRLKDLLLSRSNTHPIAK